MNQRLDSQQIFATHDLGLCCALLTLGFSITKLDDSDSGRVGFLFTRGDELDQAVEDYWSDKITVNPKQYFNFLKDTKSRLYSQR